MSLRRGMMLALSLILGSACAAGVEDPGPPPKPAPDPAMKYGSIDDFCKARAAAECNELVAKKCGTAGVDACIATRTTVCKEEAPQGATLVTKNADACIAAVKSAFEDAKISVVERTGIVDVCGAPLFSGPGAVRAPCTTDFDCATIDGLSCVVPPDEKTGKCLARHLVEPAAPCPGEADVCPGDYFCEGKSKTCAPRALEGQDCQSVLHPCNAGLWCPNTPFGGGCRPLAGSGEACKLDGDCVPSAGLCDKLVGSPQGNCTDVVSLTALDSLCAAFK
jgi:hypothetical protein